MDSLRPERNSFADGEIRADLPPHEIPSPVTFPFFTLPRELRGRVYGFAFEEQTPLLQPDQGSAHHCQAYYQQRKPSGTIYFPGFDLRAYKWEVTNGGTSASLHTIHFPGYKLVSKRFLAEAVERFARNKVFEILSFPNGQRYYAVSHFLYGLPPRLHSQNFGHRKAFLQAVRRVKLPSVVNSISTTVPPAILGFPTKDVEAMLAFHKLRGLPTLPLDLELEWKYTLESHPVYEHPQFISITLESWKDMFVRVNVTATICDRRLKKQILQSADAPSLDDQQSLALVEYRLYREATRLAQLLVRKNGSMTFGFSTKRAGLHWTGSSTCTRTIEVVDGETRQVTPVALFRYDR